MPPLSVMIKPASGLCNMRCRYCFYADEQRSRAVADYGIMAPAVQRAVLERVLQAARGRCTIVYQGGEPTCAGLDYFRRAMELQAALCPPGLTVENAIQTNGYAIDDEWAAFLARHRFLVGVSLDGVQAIHDQNRPDAAGAGTHARVMKAIAALRRHGARFNILTVVTAAGARSARKIYGFYQKNGFDYQQYIPCLDPLDAPPGGQPYSLTPEAYGRFLKDLFDCWYEDAARGRMTYNRYFTNLLRMLTGQPPEACGMLGVCSRQYVVEADGSVYPCDFYMTDPWRLGNFVTDTVADIDRARDALGFIDRSRRTTRSCQGCPWYALCRGGCLRDWYAPAPGQPARNRWCQAYQDFFPYAWPRLAALARALGPR